MGVDSEILVPEWLVADETMPSQSPGDEIGQASNEERNAARSYLKSVGLPTSSQEDWKYTSLRDLSTRSLSWVIGKDQQPHCIGGQLLSAATSFKLVIANGKYELSQSSFPEQKISVTSRPLFSIEDKHLKLAATQISESFTAALNFAHAAQEIVVEVKTGAIIDKPLEVIIANDLTSNQANACRIVFTVEDNAEISVVENHRGSGEGLSSVVVEYVVGKNSQVNQFKLVQGYKNQIGLTATYITQEQNSQFRHASFFASAKLYRNEIFLTLAGEGAECHFNSLSLLSGNDHVDNFTIVTHQAPHCNSNQRFKGIYNDVSRGVFTGTIVVKPGAQKTNAYQSNANLLLSPTSKVEARPQLKIWADDVKCTHGEACGQLDEEAMFYMQARGISKIDAKRILVRSFAQEIIESIGNEEVNSFVGNVVEQQLSRS